MSPSTDDRKLTDSLAEARYLVGKARSVAVLTGAGVSAESGVPTFRSAGGFWKGLSAAQLATPEGFAADPKLVWEWYNDRRARLREVRPNPAHFALAELERRVPDFVIATQNVDRLHQTAGSRRVVELHGNIHEVRCTRCGETTDRCGVALPDEPKCERCGAWLRPAVVWFGEDLPVGAFAQAEAAARASEVFLVVGTSSAVWPAAGLAHIARDAGATVIEINPEPGSAAADLVIAAKAGEALPVIVGPAA